MCDILCTADDITSTISHQTTVFMMSHPLQALHHTPCIRYCTHCIFVITTSPQISHPLLYDITPTICVTSYSLYITSYPLLMSSHYSTYESTTLTYETTSSMQFKMYTIPVISQSLVCVITPTVLRASHTLFEWHHTQHRYSILCTIEDITSSLYEIKAPFFMTSHPLYFTSYWCYISHHIDSIDDITPNLFMRSQPLYMLTSYPLYTTTYSLYFFHHSHCTCVSHPPIPWYHTLCIHDIAHTICLTSGTLYKVSYPTFMTTGHIIYDITCTVFMSSLPRYLTLHPQYLCPHYPSTYDLWTTVCMTSHPFYI